VLSLELSLDVCSKVFAVLTLSLDRSFTISFVCWSEVLNASIPAKTMLFVNLVAVTKLSAWLLTTFAYTSDILREEITGLQVLE